MSTKPFYQRLEDHLGELEEIHLRAKARIGEFRSPDYDAHFDEARNRIPVMPPDRRAGLMASIIIDAYHMGYEVADYLAEMKRFCEEHKL